MTPADVPGGNGTNDGDGPNGEVTPPPGDWTVVDLRTVRRTLALPTPWYAADDAEVRVWFAGTATADHPATIRATLTNRMQGPNTIALRDLPPFGDPYSAPPDAGIDRPYRDALAFAPTERTDLAEAIPGVERTAEGYWRLPETGTWLPETLELGSGETVAGEFVLVRHPEARGYPTGCYEWRSGETRFTVAAWDTGAPGPDETSRFAGESVPSLPDASSVAWFHEAGGTTPAFLEPSAERVEAPARVGFTLYNHSGDEMGGNRHDWRLFKLVDGEWFHVVPWAIPVPYTTLPPGGTEEWTIRAFSGRAAPCDDGIDVGYLGGGRYAFRVALSRESDGESDDDGEGVHAALFDLDAPAIEVTPTDDVRAARDGERVVVTSPRHRAEGEHRRPATLTLTRTDADADERLVPEQVMRRRLRGLRNALAGVEAGVETVVLRTDERTAERAVDYDADSRTVEFEGDTYRVTVSRGQ